MKENPNWKFLSVTTEGQYLEVAGVNIWKHKWNTNYESIVVKDPQYRVLKTFTKYWIVNKAQTIEFVAGEFSASVYGVYVRAVY